MNVLCSMTLKLLRSRTLIALALMDSNLFRVMVLPELKCVS